ncbi:MAG TPA: hypothetical protein VM370_05765 [Candidatus Thermoplasmatota archaeon]|nr:hypothetical protein [Candidatus Thermoplasmatota archaeon]
MPTSRASAASGISVLRDDLGEEHLPGVGVSLRRGDSTGDGEGWFVDGTSISDIYDEVANHNTPSNVCNDCIWSAGQAAMAMTIASR